MTSSSFQRSSLSTRFRSLAALALALAGVSAVVGGCASTVADLPVVGLPASTPARPAAESEYLAVHDLPPPRPQAVMTPEEVEKAEKELIAARNRQAFGAAKPPRKGATGNSNTSQDQK